MSAPLVRETGGGDFQKLEPGSYPAVCTWIIGIGPQPTPWGVKEKLKFRFEIPSERIEWIDQDGKEQEGPAIIWGTWTASLSPKAELLELLQSWRGRPFTKEELAGFDLNTVLGAPCQLVVVHKEGKNGKTYDQIASISRLMKGVPVPKPEGELIGFDPRSYTKAEFDRLPEWAQNLVTIGVNEIQLAEDLDKAVAESAEASAFADDDIPF